MNLKSLSVTVMLAATCFARAETVTYRNPVIPGDYPDPSLIRVGNDYYATATTSEWAPIFPILHSRDLVNWTNIGAVFQRRPEWSVGNYWAPEIAEHNGRFFIYYTARTNGGPLSVAVASADRPQGPYTDHGPMISQDAGSIDGFPVTGEDGKRYLIWKEDGNSRNRPTPLWIQELSADGTKLMGEMQEILRNDVPWEGRVVEGPFVIRHGEYFYLFYAGGACCGRGCSYGTGVARAKKILGPWEKNPKNPIMFDNEIWKCPGHGSIVQGAKGDFYFMYHAYHANDFVYVGRQALLDKIEFDADGWPVVNRGAGASFAAAAPHQQRAEHRQFTFQDEFLTPELDAEWQWPQNNEPLFKLSPNHNGSVNLRANPARTNDALGGVLAVKTTSGSYVAQTVLRRDSLKPGTLAGISAFGDQDNALGLAIDGETARLWRRAQRRHETILTQRIPPGERVFLKMTATAGHNFSFAVSADGREWRQIAGEASLEGNYLPPWDRGIRVALTVGGEPDSNATFESLEIESTPPRLTP